MSLLNNLVFCQHDRIKGATMNTLNFPVFTASCLIITIFTCGLDQKTNVAVNARTSSCGGFANLSKRNSINYIQDSSTYCDAERLIWTYHSNEKQLDVMHTRIGANCAATLQVTVEKVYNSFELHEKDTHNPNVMANCDCVFDTYCEIQNVQGPSVEIGIGSSLFELDLSEGFGTIILDSLPLYQCGLNH